MVHSRHLPFLSFIGSAFIHYLIFSLIIFSMPLLSFSLSPTIYFLGNILKLEETSPSYLLRQANRENEGREKIPVIPLAVYKSPFFLENLNKPHFMNYSKNQNKVLVQLPPELPLPQKSDSDTKFQSKDFSNPIVPYRPLQLNIRQDDKN